MSYARSGWFFFAIAVVGCAAFAVWVGVGEERAEAPQLEHSEHERTSKADESAATPRIDRESGARIRVRCEDSHGWELEGAFVTLRAPGHEDVSARADEQGIAVLEIPYAFEGKATISGAASDYADQTRIVEDARFHDSETPFVLVLPRRDTLFGRVIDPLGQPVPDIRVELDSPKTLRDRTREDGLFAFGSKFPPGKHVVNFEGGEKYFDLSVEIEVPIGGLDHAFTLRPRRRITGVVHDEVGSPLAGLPILADGERDRASTRSDEAGRFVLVEIESSPESTHLEIPPGATQGWRSAVPVGWGSSGVVLTPARTYELDLRVVSAETKEAVDEFGVHLLRRGQDPSYATWRARGHHEGGLARVARIQPGEWWLRVVPREPIFAPSPPVPIRIETDRPRSEPLVVELAATARLEVYVCDSSGLPLRGAHVELVHHGSAEPATKWKAHERDEFGLLRAAPDQVFFIDGDLTNESGRVALLFPVGTERMAVRVEHQGHATASRECAFAPGERIEISLQPGAGVDIRIDLPGRRWFVREVWIAPLEASSDPALVACCAPRAPSNDTFTFRDLPAGEFRLCMRTSLGVLERPSDRFTTVPGEPREIRVDLRDLELATIDVSIRSIRALGESQGTGKLLYARSTDPRLAIDGSIDLDRAGNASNVSMLPGAYTFTLDGITVIGTVVLRPGEHAKFALD